MPILPDFVDSGDRRNSGPDQRTSRFSNGIENLLCRAGYNVFTSGHLNRAKQNGRL